MGVGHCESTDESSRCPPVAETYFEAIAVSVSGLAGTDSWVRFLESPDASALAHGREVTGFPNRWPDRTTETNELKNFIQNFIQK